MKLPVYSRADVSRNVTIVAIVVALLFGGGLDGRRGA